MAKTVVVYMRVPAPIAAKLRELAEATGLTQNAVAVIALTRGLGLPDPVEMELSARRELLAGFAGEPPTGT